MMSISSEDFINFGYFSDAVYTPARTWVLVIHHGFENHEDPRAGNDKDVENLKTTFIRRNCLFVELKSNTKKEILSKITSQEDLFQLFSGKTQCSKNDAPAVLFVFILSHGKSGGAIETDHIDPATNECEIYYQKDVWEGLSGMTYLQECLKVLFFGPCRGSNEEYRLPLPETNTLDTYNKNNNRQNREVPIWGAIGPNCKNFITFYSTVESTKAQRNSQDGSWFVHEFCKELNEMRKNCDFTTFLARVQKRINLRTTKHNTFIGQTPQLQIFNHDKFTVYGYPHQDGPGEKQGGESKEIVTESEEQKDFYTWKSRDGFLFRRGRALIFYDSKHAKKAELAEKSFNFLDFATRSYRIERLERVMENVSNANDCGLQEEGCIAVCIMASLIYNKDDGLTICTDDLRKPVNELITPLIGVNCKDLSGKPKLFFFLDNGGQEDDRHVTRSERDWEVISNNHAEIFMFVGIGQPGTDIVKRFFNELQNPQLKCGLHLQEAVINVIREASNDSTSKGKIMPQVSSTLHSLIDFSRCKNAYIRPSFAHENENLSFENVSKEIAESAIKSEEHWRNRFWLIIAAGGYGKSAATIEMAKALADLLPPEFQIINFSLTRMCKYLSDVKTNGLDTADLRDFLKKAFVIKGNDLALFEEKYAKKQIVVLIDGYDTIWAYEEIVLKFLTEIHETQICLWVTTRPHQQSKIIEKNYKLSKLKINPMSREQQVELLRTMLYKNTDECEELLSRITTSNDNGVPFTATPLQLKMIAEIADDVVEGMSISSLYYKFVFSKVDSAIFQNCGTVKNKNTGYYELVRERIELLMVAAFNCVYREKVPSRELELSSITKDEIRKINQLGIATITSEGGESIVNFEHQTYAEYLIGMFFLTKAGHFTDEDYECYLENIVEINLSDLFLRKQFEQVRSFIDGFFVGFDCDSKIEKTKLDRCCSNIDFQSKSEVLISYVCKEGLRRLFKIFFESEYKVTFGNITVLVNTPYAFNYGGETFQYYPFYAACYSNDEELALHLLNVGADIKLLDPKKCQIEWQDTILHLAAERGLAKVVEKILKEMPLMIWNENAGRKLPLDIAVEKGHLECVKLLITKPICPAGRLHLRKMALMKAAQKGHVDIVFYLMDGAEPSLQLDSANASPLYWAAFYGHMKLLEALIDKAGIDVNVENNDGYTPIQAACRSGEVEAVKLLLNRGANLNSITKDTKRTLVHLAALANEACLDFLLKTSIDIDARDYRGETAFLLAASIPGDRSLKILKKLKDAGANINLRSKTVFEENDEVVKLCALCKAALTGGVGCLRYLLQLDYYLTLVKTAFRLCLVYRNINNEFSNAIEAFLDYGKGISADMHLIDQKLDEIQPVFILAERSAKCEITKCDDAAEASNIRKEPNEEIHGNLEYDAPFHHTSTELRSVASNKNEKNKYIKCIQLLIDRGANASPGLYSAAKAGDCDLMNVLFQNGADVNSNVYSGDNALHKAAREGQLNATKILLSKGANINARASFCSTPLFLAVNGGHAQVVQYLLEHGADISLCSYEEDKISPISKAAKMAREDLVDMILAKAQAEQQKEFLSLALLGAIKGRSKEYCQKLRSRGADQALANAEIFPYERSHLQIDENGYFL